MYWSGSSLKRLVNQKLKSVFKWLLLTKLKRKQALRYLGLPLWYIIYSCDFMVVFNYIFLSTIYVVKKYLGTQSLLTTH